MVPEGEDYIPLENANKPARRQSNGNQFAAREGDWPCDCGNTNFAWRGECHKCKKPRPGGVPANVAKKPAARGISSSLNKSRDNSKGNDRDWTCECGKSNFARRNECFKCNKSKPEGGTNKKFTNPNAREGDWSCECGANNFSRRTDCFKCAKKRPGGFQKGANNRNSGSRDSSNVREGDWTCDCGESNFARRAECFKCKKSRPGGVPKSPNKGPRDNSNVREGDWTCDCGESNFARRAECFKCKKSRPGGVPSPKKPSKKPQKDTPASEINRKARLIVRNLPFKAKESDLKKHFAPYGDIEEVCMLKRQDGKLVGCAFVQYKKVNDAVKAVKETKNKKFMDRPLRVEFALSKQDYAKKKGLKTEDDDEQKVKKEVVKKEEKDPDDEEKPVKKGPRRSANDAGDGRTLFIKNLPFDTTDEELGQIMSQFGMQEYALTNREPISGHSKGTGFVRFRTKESADLCLQNSGKIQVKDFTLDVFPAMSRNEAKQKHEEDKKKEPKDSRNLYLVKEGVILAGSSAAEGVSASDMQKRLHLEKIKAQWLKDLNRFVARDRLTIHNLPEKYDDKKLKGMVIQQTGETPKECKVMRENKPSKDFPGGNSKGFGFLSFETHEIALKVLRKLNNNPNIFGKNNRPIVSFSIEDKKAINLKQKRLEKSLLNNPTYQAKLEKEKNPDEKPKKKAEENFPGKFVLLKRPADDDDDTNENPKKKKKTEDADFVGLEAKEGVTRMRSRSKLDAQAQKHAENTHKLKKQQKRLKLQEEIRKEKQEIGRTKKKKVEKDDNFGELFTEYKNLFKAATSTDKEVVKKKKQKWHEGVGEN
ncbi:RNA-binding protein 28 [Culicoides brevitarsis]|uniref:RNA-binding protein 28 n=1 Tax=Culicoides brevitarsis TaxID=469753 RepID=UPI00307B2040